MRSPRHSGLVRSLAQRAPGLPVVVSALTSGLLAVVGDDDVDPEKGALLGLCGDVGARTARRRISLHRRDHCRCGPRIRPQRSTWCTRDVDGRRGRSSRFSWWPTPGARFQQLRLDAAEAGSQPAAGRGDSDMTGGLGPQCLSSLARGIAEWQRVRLALLAGRGFRRTIPGSRRNRSDDQAQHLIGAVAGGAGSVRRCFRSRPTSLIRWKCQRMPRSQPPMAASTALSTWPACRPAD